MESINCKYPRVIVNPLAVDILSCDSGSDIYAFGVRLHRRGFFKDGNFNYGRFSSKNTKVTSIDSRQWVVCASDGRYYPFYLVVPCGKCALCAAKIKEDWSCRFECETALSFSVPVFFTLTYSPEHLPENDWKHYIRHRDGTYDVIDVQKGVNKIHIQLFMKRFRKVISRYTSRKLRYVIVAEYGKNGTFRPHYHVTLWNYPTPTELGIPENLPTHLLDIKYILKSEDILHSCWDYSAKNKSFDFDYVGVKKKILPNGHRRRIIDGVGNTKGVGKYVAKYIRKKSIVPEGSAPCFMLASNRGGGIGVPYIKQHFNFYSQPCNSQFVYVSNKFNKSFSESKFLMPSLFKRHLFMCASSIFKKDFRDNLQHMYTLCNTLSTIVCKVSGFKGNFTELYPLMCAFKFSLPDFKTQLTYDCIDFKGKTIFFYKEFEKWRHYRLEYLELCAFIRSEIDKCNDFLLSHKDYLSLSSKLRDIKLDYADYIQKHVKEREFDVNFLNNQQIYFDKLNEYKNTF